MTALRLPVQAEPKESAKGYCSARIEGLTGVGMGLASFGLLLVVPSAIVGFLLVRRASKAMALVGMLATFALTALALWSSLTPLVASTQGRLYLIAEIVVALFVAGFKLPFIGRLYTYIYRTSMR